MGSSRAGKRGSREACETRARKALSAGQSVVIDRMHLEPSQREPFVNLGKQQGVPVHLLQLLVAFA